MAGEPSSPSPTTRNHPPGDPRPLVYFFCVGNAIRSQIAEGFLRHHAGHLYRAASAGTQPLGYVLPEVVQVMREKDIDLRLHESTDISTALVAEAAHLIDLGCHVHDRIPVPHLVKLQVWPVLDPYGMGLRTLRGVRDEIEELVQAFIADQGQAAVTPQGPGGHPTPLAKSRRA